MHRRSYLRGLAAAGAFGTVAGCTANPFAGTDDEWAMPGHDAGNTGFNPNTSLDHGGLVENWRREDVDPQFDNAPIVYDKTVFVMDRNNDALVGLSVEDGSDRWRNALDGLLREWVVADHKTVYVATVRGSGPDTWSVLHAFASDDGTRRWDHELKTSWMPPVTVFEDTVVAASDEHLYALDSDDGAVRWHRELDAEAASTQPVVDQDSLYVLNVDGDVLAVDPVDGTKRWQITGEDRSAVFSQDLVAIDGNLYAMFADSVVAIKDGTTHWSFEFDGSPLHLAADDERVYVGESTKVGFKQRERSLHALDRQRGESIWSLAMEGLSPFPVTVGKETVVVSGNFWSHRQIHYGTKVFGVNPDDGQQQWTRDPSEPLQARPTLAGDQLFAAFDGGRVVAYDTVEDG